MTLSILICTTIDRRVMFLDLQTEFYRQIVSNGLATEVEVLYEEDNKEMSVGAKRQILLERAIGDWIVYFDSDDKPNREYVLLIYQTIISNSDIDCIGMNVDMTTDGNNPQKCCHRLKYPEWKDNIDGWDYVRNITHFNPIKRKLALMVGFKDERFGEDKIYSDLVTKLCKKEAYIEQPLFHYRYTTQIPHKEKYGIR